MNPEQPQYLPPEPATEQDGNHPYRGGYEQSYTAPHQYPHSSAPPAEWRAQAGQHAQPWSHAMPQRAARSYAWIWALVGGLAALVIGAVSYFAIQAGSDSFSSLQEFPAESYLRNHEGLMGSHFRADMTLEAELGSEMGRGRMFSFRETTSGRLVPVLVLDSAGQAVFDKGQRYVLQLEVRQGGLIQARACKKS